jgi:Asp-tRNA(Asn)/Glu-tRNA(Gln) amidotransferase A subunit family amidase
MVAQLASGALSAEEAVSACLARIAEREPVVQAWEALDGEAALREARRIDALPASQKPLLCGLPIGVKDLIDTADFPTGYGSPIHSGHRAARDAASVAALRTAGAIVLGKTVTTEFAVYAPGKTRNPHDPSRTPGGSSSGSAAAVADGMVPAALGTQTAASIIRPASFCGVVGWKPTFGTLPLEGVHPLAPSLDTLGFLVAALEDVPLLTAAIAAVPPRPLQRLARPPRLALCRTELWERAEPSTRGAIEAAATKLERAGAEVRELELGPLFRGLVEAQIAIMGAEAAVALRDKPRAQLSEKLRVFLEMGEAVTPERLGAARAQAARCGAELDAAFASPSGFDALLTPAAAGEAPQDLTVTGDPVFSRMWTLLGVPSLSLPLLSGPAGMPLGLQLIGRRGGDEGLLGAGAWVVEQR